MHMLLKCTLHINLLLELHVVFFSGTQSAKKLINSTTLPPINFSLAMTLSFMNTFFPINYHLPFLHLLYHQLNPQLPHQSFPFPSPIFLQQISQSPLQRLPLQSLHHLPSICTCHHLSFLCSLRVVPSSITALPMLYVIMFATK